MARKRPVRQHRKKNILYLTSSGELKGGGQHSLLELILNLDKDKFCPFLVSPTDGNLVNRLISEGYHTKIIDVPKVLNISFFKTIKGLSDLLKVVKKYSIDLIHTDAPRNTFYGGIIGKIMRIPVVWHVRVSEKDRFDRCLYSLSDKMILVADSLRTRFSWANNIDKFVTIYNGVDLRRFKPSVESEDLSRIFKIEPGSITIAQVGRIEYIKGQGDLIDACSILRNNIEKFHVLFIGAVQEKAYFQSCQSKIRALSLEKHVTFTGKMEPIESILNSVDICVLPSKTEGFSRAVIEAMALSKPVIATNVGGNAEAIYNDVSGYIISPGDIGLLENRLRRLCQTRELRERFGKNAGQRVKKLFTIERSVRKTENIYTHLLAPNHLQTSDSADHF